MIIIKRQDQTFQELIEQKLCLHIHITYPYSFDIHMQKYEQLTIISKTREMAQWVKVPAVKPADGSSIQDPNGISIER